MGLLRYFEIFLAKFCSVFVHVKNKNTEVMVLLLNLTYTND